MKHFIYLAAAGLLLLMGLWMGKTNPPQIAVVDMNQIIHQMAENLARKNLNPEQIQIQISKFKNDLHQSLKEYAKNNKILISSSHTLFGDVPDKTEAFIRFYNEGASS